MPSVNVNDGKVMPFWLPQKGVAGWRILQQAVQHCLDQSQFELSVEGFDIQKTVKGVHIKPRGAVLPPIPAYPDEDGDYVLVLTMNDHVPTLAWEIISDC